MDELLSLKWNNHKSTFIHVLSILREKQLYTDATIACDGKFYSVHKLVLSTCSDYFSAILDRTNCKNPVIVLKDIKNDDLEALLDYMYLGEVNVRQCDLATLIKAAECLRVKGLAVPDDEPPPPTTKKTPRESAPKRTDSSSSPPAKRKRRSELEDGRDDVRNVKGELRHSSPSRIMMNNKPKSPISTSLSPLRNTSIRPESSEKNHEDLNSNLPSSVESNVQNEHHSQPYVKVEMDEGGNDVETYDLSNDGGFKEEGSENNDDGSVDAADMGGDLPEFLQQAAGGPLSGANFSQSSFSGSTSFQPGDLSGWQGDGSNVSFPGMNFSTSEGSSQQNTQGAEEVDSCELCGKDFTGKNRRNNLARHVRTHTGEKPYSCPACPYRATRKEHMIRHLKKGSCVYHKYRRGGTPQGPVVVPTPPSDLMPPPTSRTPPVLSDSNSSFEEKLSSDGSVMDVFLKEIVRLSGMNGKQVSASMGDTPS